MITKPMLACNTEDINKINFPMLCTPKLDGIRAIKQGGRMLSRKFIEIPNEKIQNKFAWLPDGMDGELIKVDGEWSGCGFNETQSLVMREEISDEDLDKIWYFIFDYVKDSLKTPYIDRISNLLEFKLKTFKQINELKGHPVKEIDGVMFLIPFTILDITELNELEEDYISQGYEGVILRSKNGPYKLGRSTFKEQYLLKLKRFHDSEAKILGFEERMHNDNEMGRDNLGHAKRSSKKEGMVGDDRLGSLLVSDIYSNVEFYLGSGFDDSLRKEIWNNQSKYLGTLVKYKCQPSGAKDKPRFPVFLGFRDERDL